MKKRPFWKRPPLWSAKFGFRHLPYAMLFVAYETRERFITKIRAIWRELTWTKEQRRLQVLAGIRKGKNK